jgi:hypothetical protein
VLGMRIRMGTTSASGSGKGDQESPSGVVTVEVKGRPRRRPSAKPSTSVHERRAFVENNRISHRAKERRTSR